MNSNKIVSYKEFLANIGEYVGKIVELTIRMKATGKTRKTERYVWDDHEFCELRPDALIEVLGVRYVRDGVLDKSVKGIIGVR